VPDAAYHGSRVANGRRSLNFKLEPFSANGGDIFHIFLKPRNQSARKSEQADGLVRVYAHFLLFWVIFAAVMITSIIMGVALGGLVIYILKGPLGLLDAGQKLYWYPSVSNLAKSIFGIFIGGLTLYFFASIQYDPEMGYRLKTDARRFVARTAGFIALFTAIIVSVVYLLG
jgi:hypothetical protein